MRRATVSLEFPCARWWGQVCEDAPHGSRERERNREHRSVRCSREPMPWFSWPRRTGSSRAMRPSGKIVVVCWHAVCERQAVSARLS